jgi:hypothetical protein
MPHHSGIVVCTFDLDFDAQAQRVHAAVAAAPSTAGALFRVNRPG